MDPPSQSSEDSPSSIKILDLLRYVLSRIEREMPENPSQTMPEEMRLDLLVAGSLILGNLSANDSRVISPAQFQAVADRISEWQATQGKTIVYFQWKIRSEDDEGNVDYLTPQANGHEYEHPFDYLFSTIDQAHRGLIDFNGESGWVLCRVTQEPISAPMSIEEFEALQAPDAQS